MCTEYVETEESKTKLYSKFHFSSEISKKQMMIRARQLKWMEQANTGKDESTTMRPVSLEFD